MVDQVKIITGRRAYIFRPDDLRLSTLTLDTVANTIGAHFGFKGGTIATPPETIGPVPETMPPGLVFNFGAVQPSAGPEVAIRFLHFEPQRIVVDVAGPSSVIDEIFDQLLVLLEDMQTPDGSPLIGEPSEAADHSEIAARLSFEIGDLVAEPLLELVRKALVEDEETGGVFPFILAFQAQRSPGELVQQATMPQAALQVRAGTRVEERIYHSTVGVTTEENLAWLEALDERLGKTSNHE